MKARSETTSRSILFSLWSLVAMGSFAAGFVPVDPGSAWEDGAVAGVGAVICPLAILLAVRHGYLLARAVRWKDRQVRERANVARLSIPITVRRPDSFPDVAAIDAAQTSSLSGVPNAQGLYRARALMIFAAAPVAVLLSGLQAVGWPAGPFGAGLLMAQLSLLVVALVLAVNERRPTAAWVEHRTRSELFRREQYLCLAHVGPYSPTRALSSKDRIGRLASAEDDTLFGLAFMEQEEAGPGRPWLDEIGEGSPSLPLLPDLAERVACYKHYRIGKQIAWMHAARGHAEMDSKWLEQMLSVTLAAGALLATYNAARVAGIPPVWPQPVSGHPSGGLVGVGAFLPALSGTLLAIQGVFNLRYLSSNYRIEASSLERFQAAASTLEDDISRVWSGASSADRRSLEVRFQRLVLHVEASLTQEYIRWRMITQRDVHDLT